MKISIREYQDIKILYIEGYLKDSYCALVQDRFHRVLELSSKIVCYMELVTYIGPEVLHIFFQALRKARENQGDIKFSNAHKVRVFFDRVGLNEDSLFYEDLQQAIDAFGQAPPPPPQDPHTHTTIKAEHIDAISTGNTGTFDETTISNERNVHRALSLYAKVYRAGSAEKIENLTLEEIKRSLVIYSRLQQTGAIATIDALAKKYNRSPEQIVEDFLARGLSLYKEFLLPFCEEYHEET